MSTRLLGRASLANVPSDQQKLLDRHGLGAVPPRGHCPSLDDVPSHVLPGVIDALLERRKRCASDVQSEEDRRPTKSPRTDVQHKKDAAERETSQLATTPAANSLQDETNSLPSGATQQQEASARATRLPQSTPPKASNQTAPQSSPSVAITWSASSREREDDEEQEDNQMEDAGTSSKKPSGFPQPDMIVQSIETNPSQPKIAASRPVPRPAPTFDFPSSAPEEDLEVELPQAHGKPVTSTQEPAPRAAIPESSIRTPGIRIPPTMDTPPCAQLSQQIIPATVESNSPPKQQTEPLEQAAPQEYRPKRMKPLKLSEPWAANALLPPVNASTAVSRLATTKSYQALESSNSTSSSSIVAVSQLSENPTVVSSASGLGQTLSVEEPEPNSEETAPRVSEERSHGNQSKKLEEPPEKEEDKFPDRKSRRYSTDTSRSHSEAPLLLDRPCLEAFDLAYPAYMSECGGSLASFVKACLCLEQMANRRSLHQCLWDDFIRFCASDYFEDAQHTIDPLTASNLYHDTVINPRFCSSRVNDKTLPHFLNQYPEEVARAREHVTIAGGDSKMTRPNPPETGTSAHMPNHSIPSPAPLPKRKRGSSITQQAAPKARAVSNPPVLPKSGGLGRENERVDVSKKVGSKQATRPRHSLGSLAVNANTNTPSAVSGRPIARLSTPSSSVASSPGSIAAYIRTAKKRKSTGPQEKRWRDIVDRPSKERSSG